ncbi:MAG: DUF2759 domain-containing protein [Bacillaceae bacterium]|jgi:hypothetical protein|uniref:DUF2759 domain-containing protein n=2 Tax=Aeribacillus TaxID=1055323 RepID=A0A223E9H6_9BACI|nr:MULTISPECIES: DUF2759 domain-containing protein [Aeribacillus]REJ18509.1 MAG: DUF2759 domain-containing protein [Bacillaceae bacterium]ASS91906.1 DUF2759 domain-containing protein [Aeribacillus pallidus]MDR9794394.1 DUF2759 domain-containing protein [Aeribacillus pallidus]MDR9795746.1 DUF2759 domain-containing protein [Aeribacillus pallidus]MED0649675.1 DUF2759 domain-containing protein [Aeribacillus composti]
MGTVIIFTLVTLLGIYAIFRSLKQKNILGILFALGTVAVFGWFTYKTIVHHGIPVPH